MMRPGWKWTGVVLVAIVLAMLLAGWTWDDTANLWTEF